MISIWRIWLQYFYPPFSLLFKIYCLGSFIGCTGILLIGGAPAQVACNMVTTPGSIGCGINTLNCFMESCGLIRMTLP